jgi:hypothetical protein
LSAWTINFRRAAAACAREQDFPEDFTFSLLIAAVEFALAWKSAYYVESRGISDDRDH